MAAVRLLDAVRQRIRAKHYSFLTERAYLHWVRRFGGNRVALLSREYQPSQVQAWFELKRELHRRFTPEQKLGNVFAWTWHGLTLRPGSRAFLERGMEQAGRLTADASSSWAEFARTLADGTFGAATSNGRFVTSN